MKLVICEKDLLARDISNAIAGASFARDARFPLEGYRSGDWCVAAASGHLLELASPEAVDERYKAWRIEDLPIAFENWPKVVAEGRERRVEAIGRLLAEASVVYHAGDPDDEGQLIVDELLDWFGYDGPCRRVYVNDSIPKNIVRAFDEAADNGPCRRDGYAALARQMADAAFGYSESRLATIRLNPERVVSLGRVQTPTLGRLVARDQEVEGHSSRAFFELEARARATGAGGGRSEIALSLVPSESARAGDAHVFNRGVIERAAKEVKALEASVMVTHRTEAARPPLPYNMTALQADMSKRYGFSAKRTMEITQRLRDEHAAITYNRTDCQYLKEEHFAEAESVLRVALGNLESPLFEALDFALRSKCFNDDNVSAHHGIIPQEAGFDASGLGEDELRVYTAIVERYAMQFLRPALTRVAQASVATSFGDLVYKAAKVVDAGWRGHFKVDGKGEAGAENKAFLAEGGYTLAVEDARVVERHTAPPKRYTEGSLIVDMSRIAKYVEDAEVRRILEEKDKDVKGEHGSIGTSATRHEVIDKLKARGYAETKGKNLVSTELGRKFFSMLPREISGVDTTARWCLVQQDIREGKADANALMRSVVEVFEAHKDTAYEGMTLGEPRTVVGKCPLCGEEVVKHKRAYACTSNRAAKRDDGTWEDTDGCGFKILPFCGHDLTPAEAGRLLAEGRTPVIKGFVSKKTGKRFDAALGLGEDGRLKPLFPPKGGPGRKGRAPKRSSPARRPALPR